jgi:hypothetical protein
MLKCKRFFFVVSLALVILVSGCGGGSGSSAPVGNPIGARPTTTPTPTSWTASDGTVVTGPVTTNSSQGTTNTTTFLNPNGTKITLSTTIGSEGVTDVSTTALPNGSSTTTTTVFPPGNGTPQVTTTTTPATSGSSGSAGAVSTGAGSGSTSSGSTTPPTTGSTGTGTITPTPVTTPTPTPAGLVSAGGGDYIDPSTGNLWVSTGGQTYLNADTGDLMISLGGGSYLNTATGQIVFSVSDGTKDVNLQQSQIQQQSQNSRAQSLVGQFGMSFDKAVQVTALSDRMQQLTRSNGQMSADDQAQLLDSAYAVVGVSGDAVRAATVKIIQDHDPSAANALVEQAAKNLGMPSSAALRSQILPSLGIVLNQL